jgi:hypothetical protein
VALALVDLRYDLAADGLLRILLPGRTRAGRRILRSLRDRHSPPSPGRGLSAQDRLLPSPCTATGR